MMMSSHHIIKSSHYIIILTFNDLSLDRILCRNATAINNYVGNYV